MEERGLGKPWANSNVREEWELKGTDVTQLKIRVQGFFPTLGKKVSEQPGIEEEQILCGSWGEGGRAPGNSGANSARHGCQTHCWVWMRPSPKPGALTAA